METATRYTHELHAPLKEDSLMDRSAVIRSFVRDVEVTNNEVALNYTMPVLSDNVVVHKDGVPPAAQYGRQYWTIGGTFELAFNLV